MAKIACWKPTEHRNLWRVLTRDRLKYHVDDIGFPTPGTSTLLCIGCQVVWRSTAKYIAGIPNHNPLERTGPTDSRPEKIADLVALHSLLAELTYDTERGALAGTSPASEPFLHNVGMSFVRTGTLSESQLQWSLTLIRRAIVKANKQQAEQAAQRALGPRLAPVGDQVVQGVVEEVWRIGEEAFAQGAPGTPKMRVRADAGWSVEVTVPAVLRRQIEPEALKGRRVEVQAWLRHVPGDYASAWGRNPQQNARLLD